MPYQPILATLGYLLSADARRVLMVHRNARPGDQHLGKYNGLGGKLEADEDVAAGMRREIQEEAGVDWFGFIFLIPQWQGEPPAANAEGSLEWVEVDALDTLPLWEGDRHFLPLVFDGDPRPFHGVMPYRDGRMLSWRVSR